jgi:tetratricopeptide (TPR) repeat protein
MINLKTIKIEHKISLLLLVLTFLLYGNTIKNSYAFDDNYVAVTNSEHPNNPRIEKGIKGIVEIFKTHYVEIEGQSFEYRPLVLTSFAIEYQFFGSNPHVSHFINILLYGMTCIVLFLLLNKLFKKYNIIFPLLSTLLFLVHPIHTEVVASIKSRDELLAFLFGILSFYFVLKSLESKQILNMLIAVLFFFLASLCKSTYILFLALIPISLYFFTPISFKKIGIIIISILGAVICLKLLKIGLLDHSTKMRSYAFFENPLFFEDNFLTRLPVAFYTIGYYIKLLVVPYPLCCYYGSNTIPMSQWSSPFMIISIVFYVLIGVYAMRTVVRKKVLSYGIITYLIGIFPFANIVSVVVGIVGERFIYVATYGFCISVSYLLLMLFKINITHRIALNIKDLSMPLKIFVTLILIIFTTLTIVRNTKWKDESTLFRNDVKKFDNSCNLHYLLGNKLYPEIFNTPNGVKRDAIINEATFHYKKALTLMMEGVKKYPTDFTTLNNIGTIYINIFNDAVSAQPFFRQALRLKPSSSITRYNLAYCYEKRNLPDSAIMYYEEILSENTPYFPAYIQLRELYLTKQQYLKTIECDEKLISLNPLQAKLYVNLGNSYMLNKDTLNGIIQFEKAAALEPQNMNLRNQIVTFLKSAGYIDKANRLEKRLAR